jgi:hypothetical protein
VWLATSFRGEAGFCQRGVTRGEGGHPGGPVERLTRKGRTCRRPSSTSWKRSWSREPHADLRDEACPAEVVIKVHHGAVLTTALARCTAEPAPGGRQAIEAFTGTRSAGWQADGSIPRPWTPLPFAGIDRAVEQAAPMHLPPPRPRTNSGPLAAALIDHRPMVLDAGYGDSGALIGSLTWTAIAPRAGGSVRLR